MPFVVLAKWTARPESRDVIADVIEKMTPLSRSETKCLQYDSYVSRDDPNSFLLWEIYEDESGYEEHRASAHFLEQVVARAIPNLDDRVVTTFAGD